MAHFSGSLKIYIAEASGLQATHKIVRLLKQSQEDTNAKLCPLVRVLADNQLLGNTSVIPNTAEPNWRYTPAEEVKEEEGKEEEKEAETEKTEENEPIKSEEEPVAASEEVTEEKAAEESDKTDDKKPTEESKKENDSTKVQATKPKAKPAPPKNRTERGELISIAKLSNKETLHFQLLHKNVFLADASIIIKDIQSGENTQLPLDPAGELVVVVEVDGTFGEKEESEENKNAEEKTAEEPADAEEVKETGDAEPAIKSEETEDAEKAEDAEKKEKSGTDDKTKSKTLNKPKKSAEVKENINKVHNILEHKFKVTNFKQPTFCAKCKTLLLGVSKQGFACQLCELSVHKGCASMITAECRKGKAVVGGKPDSPLVSAEEEAPEASEPTGNHNVVEKTIKLPVPCSHCGRYLAGFIGKRLQCEACKNSYHLRCRDVMCMNECTPKPPKPLKEPKSKSKEKKAEAKEKKNDKEEKDDEEKKDEETKKVDAPVEESSDPKEEVVPKAEESKPEEEEKTEDAPIEEPSE